MNVYNAVGIMSGTSLDGLDIIYCKLILNNKWEYEIVKSQTIPFNDSWKNKLTNAHLLKSRDFIFLDHEFGKYIGEKINEFISENNIDKKKIDLVSSHGHTIFHEPQNGFTYQIGNGNQICGTTKIKTVSDFRTLNVAFGGQGAPLVPVGDQLLFGNYDACLNLGGIANISYSKKEKTIAGDINFANMYSNYLAEKINQPYDENGEIAKNGKINKELLIQLNDLNFYKKTFPKSLSIEDFKNWYKPILDKNNCSVYDKLHTCGIHLAKTVKEILKKDEKLLITGGGTYNEFWIKQFKDLKIDLVIPNTTLIEFKEALIFAFLGVLKIRNEVNSLASVTGSSKNLKTGIIHTP